MNLSELGLYARTIRYLKPSQTAWRIWFTLERKLKLHRLLFRSDSSSQLSPPAEPNSFPRVPVLHKCWPEGENLLRYLEQGVFHHLNLSLNLGRERPQWRLGAQSRDRLWINELHSHYWVYELARFAGREDRGGNLARRLLQHYLEDWMERCGIAAKGARALAWNSFVLATRISWWIRAWLEMKSRGEHLPPSLESALLQSLAAQARFLEYHLEWDLRANHLMRDAVGLAWAGRFFNGSPARRWLARAAELAVHQAEEQVLPDGGHFERSPMYHLHVMEDLLQLCLLLEEPDAVSLLKAKWEQMAEFAAWMTHPAGHIPLFNDSALNGCAAPEKMLEAAKFLGLEPRPLGPRGGRHFPDTGIAVWRGEPWTLFYDLGPVGPDYQPGHAHADNLTLECSFKHAPLFVDPGTFFYDNDEKRRYDRATSSHNTVCIDGMNSSEVWHIFRVGRRAKPLQVRVDFSGRTMRAEGGHDGYDRLPGRPRHFRSVFVEEGGRLELQDKVSGKGRRLVEGGFLLHPSWKPRAEASGWVLECDGLKVRVQVESPASLSLFSEPRPYHPEYGKEELTTRIGWRTKTDLPLEVKTIVTEE